MNENLYTLASPDTTILTPLTNNSGEEDFEEEEIPKEEKLGILQYFITNAPPVIRKRFLRLPRNSILVM